jgi:hypothetical protein
MGAFSESAPHIYMAIDHFHLFFGRAVLTIYLKIIRLHERCCFTSGNFSELFFSRCVSELPRKIKPEKRGEGYAVASE